jgi:hypothetical protein
VAGAHGGIPFETKQMVYVIGVSFTAELLGKAAYEETVGRVATYVRGAERAKLDDVSARQARDYAQFLQQVPWYRWDFTRDAAELQRDATPTFRDQERKIALGLEYRAKAAYASVIAQAVANVGHDELTLRMIVDDLAGFSHPDVTFIGRSEAGVEIETVRYRALTRILIDMALSGTNFVEIAGNDDIMLTVLTDTPSLENARSSMSRQGYNDYRHIVGLKVSDLAAILRSYAASGITVEHIHDY